jgi:hypothetical protein
VSPVKRRYPELADSKWEFWEEEDGSMTRDQIQLLLLMDIRAELKKLNAILGRTATPTNPRVKKELPR